MKPLPVLLSLVLLVVLTACGSGSQGPVGPPGPQGPPGQDGLDGLIGTVFDVVVDFLPANGYEALVEIPPEIEVFDTDVVLVYVLVDVVDEVEVWEPLPQLLFFGPDLLLYAFDFTFTDVNLFLDGTVDPASLDVSFLEGLVFRIAIVPADFAATVQSTSTADAMRALAPPVALLHTD